jgi:hypothetical protein
VFHYENPPRRPTWRADLTEYLAEVARRPFRPGAHDCALFAAGAVEAMTGVNPVSEMRGAYRTLDAGRAALQAAGYRDHIAVAEALLPPVAPARASVGDLAAVRASDGAMALGVVQGSAVYVLQLDGLALVSRLKIERAFKV